MRSYLAKVIFIFGFIFFALLNQSDLSIANENEMRPIRLHMGIPLEKIFDSYKAPIREQIAKIIQLAHYQPNTQRPHVYRSITDELVAERRNISLKAKTARNESEARLQQLLDELIYIEDLQSGEFNRLNALAEEYSKLEPSARKTELEKLAGQLKDFKFEYTPIDYRIGALPSEEQLSVQRDAIERVLILLTASYNSLDNYQAPEGAAMASGAVAVSIGAFILTPLVDTFHLAPAANFALVAVGGISGMVAWYKNNVRFWRNRGLKLNAKNAEETQQHWQALSPQAELQQISALGHAYQELTWQKCQSLLRPEVKVQHTEHRVRVDIQADSADASIPLAQQEDAFAEGESQSPQAPQSARKLF